jgi:hypothetical protein
LISLVVSTFGVFLFKKKNMFWFNCRWIRSMDLNIELALAKIIQL